MSHNHHEHCHHQNNNFKKLAVVLVLTTIYMIAEFVGGWYTNSLALTADAGHMLGDVGALALSFFAIWLSRKQAPAEKTYGYFRAEIFAAFINGVALVLIALTIIYEAYLRIVVAQKIDAIVMVIIAFGGLIVNLIGVFLLHSGSKENLNIKGAFLHIIGDLLGSIGAIIAGLLIYFYNFYIADPIISVFIAALVLYSSVKLTNSAVQILMESSPAHINLQEIKDEILKLDDVKSLHDLHVWSITSQKVSLSVHVVSDFQNNEKILCEINQLLIDKFNISHTTIQIEPDNFHEDGCSLNLH